MKPQKYHLICKPDWERLTERVRCHREVQILRTKISISGELEIRAKLWSKAIELGHDATAQDNLLQQMLNGTETGCRLNQYLTAAAATLVQEFSRERQEAYTAVASRIGVPGWVPPKILEFLPVDCDLFEVMFTWDSDGVTHCYYYVEEFLVEVLAEVQPITSEALLMMEKLLEDQSAIKDKRLSARREAGRYPSVVIQSWYDYVQTLETPWLEELATQAQETLRAYGLWALNFATDEVMTEQPTVTRFKAETWAREEAKKAAKEEQDEGK